MLDELNAVSSNQGDLEEMIYEDTASDRDGRRRASMLNAISLPTRALTIRVLASAVKTLSEARDMSKTVQNDAETSAPVDNPDDDPWSTLLQ